MSTEPETRESLVELELAEAAMNRASAAAFLAEANKSLIEAERLNLSLAAEQRIHNQEAVMHKNQRMYPFVGEINEISVGDCLSALLMWDKLYPKEDMEIILNSPGGSLIHGLFLFDGIKRVRSLEHKVTITAMGMAASMAAIVLQAATERVMGRETWMLMHEVSFGAKGKIGEVEDYTTWVNMAQERIINILIERSNLTKAKIRAGWKRKDWWIDSNECLRLGLVDKVV